MQSELDLVYGNDPTNHLVALEVKNNSLYMFKNDNTYTVRPFNQWMLTSVPYPGARKLEGNLHYKYLVEFRTRSDFFNALTDMKSRNIDYYKPANDVEAAMMRCGSTLFKKLKFSDVSALFFDIEATGLERDAAATTLVIANIFRSSKGELILKTFSLDNYDSQQTMISEWCKWVREVNPTMMVGHNVFGYDLPYLNHCAGGLCLGRDNSYMKIESYVNYFRKSQTEFYPYQEIQIFGRQIIDTMFLSIKSDIKKDFYSYALKKIAEQLGFVEPGRQFYEANMIGRNWHIPEERVKIIAYAMDDVRDTLKIYDKFAPQFFYFCQSVPKSFQRLNNSSSGGPINSILVRSYLQENHSIPKANETIEYEGALSEGYEGIYNHVGKMDVRSLYPSIILAYRISNPDKDPKGHFLRMVKVFTEERLRNKDIATRTGDDYYDQLQEAQKIVINSAYGILNTPKLHFNSPKHAEEVCKRGREILKIGMDWVKYNNFTLVNIDTDSFSYTKNREMSKNEFAEDIKAVNAQSPDGIVWADDGLYRKFIVVGAKNYVMYNEHAKPDKRYKFKGSAFKSSTKEIALREMLSKMMMAVVHDRMHELSTIYNEYATEVIQLKDITRWASKVTVSEAVQDGNGSRQAKIRAALEGIHTQMGDKVLIYPAIDGTKQRHEKGVPKFYKANTAKGRKGDPIMDVNRVLKRADQYNGDADIDHLFGRLYDTILILEPILNVKMFPDYSLLGNKKLLLESLGVEPVVAAKIGKSVTTQASIIMNNVTALMQEHALSPDMSSDKANQFSK